MLKSFLIMKKITAPLLMIILISLGSCSLNYGRDENSESTIPELNFSNATFKRVEDGQTTISMNAAQLEQYKSDNASFAKDVQFSTYDDNNQLDTEGSCRLLSADTKNKKYGLYNDISLHVNSQSLEITAQALKFDGKTEQLTSNRDSEVSIKKDDMETKGRGFSASGVSKTFSFMYAVDGEVTTEDPQPEENQ